MLYICSFIFFLNLSRVTRADEFELPRETSTYLMGKANGIRANIFNATSFNISRSKCPQNDYHYGKDWALITQAYRSQIVFNNPLLIEHMRGHNTAGAGIAQYSQLQNIANQNNGSMIHLFMNIFPHSMRFLEYLFGLTLVEPCFEEICTNLNMTFCRSLFFKVSVMDYEAKNIPVIMNMLEYLLERYPDRSWVKLDFY